MIRDIQKAMENPYLVLKGSSSNPNALVEILELKDDLGRKILVSIKIDALEGFVQVSRLTSAYGKDGLNSYLTNEGIVILDINNKKRTTAWLDNRGLQLSKFETEGSSFTYIIRKIDRNMQEDLKSKIKIDCQTFDTETDMETLF